MSNNFKGWDRGRIKQLQTDGKIKGYQEPEVTFKKEEGGRKVAKHFTKKSKALDYIGWNILYWTNERCLGLEEEYVFHPDRGWRFDYAIPALKIAVEFEGGVYEKNTGHNTAKHYTKDTNKYNAAAVLGWIVLRFTAINYKNLIPELNNAIKKSAS